MLLTVGQPFPGPPLADGQGVWEWEWLVQSFAGLSDQEIRAHRHGTIRFDLADAGAAVALICRTEHFATITPYAAALATDPIDLRTDGSAHHLLSCVLTDAASGLVVSLRAVTFSAEFTSAMYAAVAADAVAEQDEAIAASNWAAEAPLELLERAVIASCAGGD